MFELTSSIFVLCFILIQSDKGLAACGGKPPKCFERQYGGHDVTAAQRANTVELGEREYLFVMKQKANWFEASRYCDILGMTLVNIESKQENDLIMQHVRSLGFSESWIFTGGNKIGQENYFWSNGGDLQFSDWAVNQPTEFNTEHCLIVWKNDWYDLPCLFTERFICEQA